MIKINFLVKGHVITNKRLWRLTKVIAIIKLARNKVSLRLKTPNSWKATSGITVFEKSKQKFMI